MPSRASTACTWKANVPETVWVRRPGAVQKRPHGRSAGTVCRKRLDRPHVLALGLEPFPAGREHGDSPGFPQQSFGDARDARRDVLTVVEHQQQLQVP